MKDKMIKRLLMGIFLFLFLITIPSFSQEEKEEGFGREDPFKPLIPLKHIRIEEITEFSLRAVFLDSDPRAILEKGEESYIIKEGDVLKGRKVKEIKEDGVILEEGKRKYVIELGKELAESEQTKSSD